MSASEPDAGDGVPASGDDAPGLPSSTRWIVTLVATSTMAISYLDRQVLAVLAPSITASLAIDDTHYGWLQSAFSIAYLACAPLAGRLLEKVGVRGGLVIAVLVWTLVSAGHALAYSFAALFVCRLLLGAAEAPSFPGATAAIARTQTPASRARALGILFTGSSIGAMIAPALATYLAEDRGYGYRGAFVGVAVIGLSWVPVWWLATRDPRVRERLARVELPKDGPVPTLRSVLSRPEVRRACLLVIATSSLFAFVLLWGSKLLHDALGVAQADVRRYLWLPPILFDLGAVAFGHLASEHTRRTGQARAPRGIVLVAALLASVLAAVPLCTSPWQVTITMGVAMAGGAGLFAILTAEMVASVGPALAATAGGATASAQSITYIVANLLIGVVVDRTHGYSVIVPAIAALVLPGTLAWLALGRAPDHAPA
jgi:ACS family hexuronate transporter-like MFS transporter